MSKTPDLPQTTPDGFQKPDWWDEMWRSAKRMAEQPSDTMTYASRVKGARVLAAIEGLTPWAQEQVLLWALDKVRRGNVNGNDLTQPTN